MSNSNRLLGFEMLGIHVFTQSGFRVLTQNALPAVALLIRIRWWLAAGGIFASTIALLASAHSTPIGRTLVSTRVKSYVGLAYLIEPRLGLGALWSIAADSNSDPRASTLKLYENGVLLGPAHSTLADIRAHGHGAYSHWEKWLFFSSSDGTDPRANGRVYTISTTPRLALWVWWILGIFDIAVLAVFAEYSRRKSLISSSCVRLAGVLPIGVAAVSSAGLFGLIARPQFGAVSSSLALAAILHVALICMITIAQWLIGAGAARMLLPKRSTFAEVVLAGFPISIILLAAFCALTLLVPFGGIISGLASLFFVIPLVRWRPDQAVLRTLGRSLPPLIILSLCFGFWMAIIWHGPTAKLPGFPLGDQVYYGSSIWALASHPLGRPNLTNEGEVLGYFNMLWPAVGASLLRLVPIDGILFIASASSAAVLGMGFALLAYFSSYAAPRLGKLAAVILCLAFIGASWFPTWLVSSPQVAFVAPLTVSIWFWSKRGLNSDRLNTANIIAALLVSALTKVVTVGTLAPLAAANSLRSLLRRPLIVQLMILLLVTTGIVYLFLLMRAYGSSILQIAPLGPDSISDPQWPYVARDAGAVLMISMAFLVLQWPVALAISAGMILFLLDPFLLRANFICATIALGLGVLDNLKGLARHRFLALTAFSLTIPAAILKDPSGLATGLVWVFAVIGIFYAVFPAIFGGQNFSRRIISTALISMAAVLVGIFCGTLPVPRGDGKIPPSMRDIWHAVRTKTALDSLIFTDQTGPDPTLLTGWNTYSLQGQRQIFIADWYQSPHLRTDKVTLSKRLQVNEQVLSGVLDPTKVQTSRRYTHFFAVVKKGRSLADGWHSIYANQNYALYLWSEKPARGSNP